MRSRNVLHVLTAAVIAYLTLGPQAFAQSVVRGPYLQTGTPTSVIIKWRTDQPTDSVVRYGTTVAAQNSSAIGNNSGTEHEVVVSGLSPNSEYFYSIGTSAGTLAGGDDSYSFVTAPQPGSEKATRIWVLGDSGTADSNAARVRDAFYSFTGSRRAEIWMMLGDNAYNDGKDTEYQSAVFNMYPAMLRQAVLWPTIGNHDGVSANSSSQSGPYYDIFKLPTNAESGGIASGTEAYYSFDYANIHFVSLDSHETNRSPGSAMLTWLENDLASTTRDWLIAFWHHPPYTKGSHNSDSESRLVEMRRNVVPILERYGVDLVLTGHSHSYERSYLIDGHYGTSGSFDQSMKIDGGSGREDDTGTYNKDGNSASNQGAVYAVAGSSGKISGGSLNHPAMYLSLNSLGSMVLDVSGGRLDAYFINASGSTRDYFSITKGADATAPVLQSVDVSDNTTVNANFSEALDRTTAENVNNYSISNGVGVVSASLDTASLVVTLTTTTIAADISHTLTVDNVEDLAGNSVAPASQHDFTLTGPPPPSDTTPPVMLSVNASNTTTVTASFSEQVDRASAETSTNFAINNGISVLSASLDPDSLGVTLTTSALQPGITYSVTVNNVQDIAGNAVVPDTRRNFVLSGPPPPPVDVEAPTTPTNARSTAATETSVSLAWNAATDNVGVTGYRVRRDGSIVATAAGTNHQDSGLTAGTTYRYTIAALDAAGNESPQTGSITVSTSTPPGDDGADDADDTATGSSDLLTMLLLLLVATRRQLLRLPGRESKASA